MRIWDDVKLAWHLVWNRPRWCNWKFAAHIMARAIWAEIKRPFRREL